MERDTLHNQTAAAALQTLLQRAAQLFTERFSDKPQCMAIAPGRINLIGEHTDYNDGLVLPMAIDCWAVAAVSQSAADAQTTVHLPDVAHLPAEHERGTRLVRHLAQRIVRNESDAARPSDADQSALRVLLISNVPIGSGLSSSAALTAAGALAIDQCIAGRHSRVDLARMCQQAEHIGLGTPCGIMDMFTSLHGRADHALLLDCRALQFDHIPLPPVEQTVLLIVDTGVHHSLASSAYAERREACQRVATTIGVAALRDATMQMLENEALDDTDRQRALHVVMENTRVLLTAAALREGDLHTAGDLMYASHDSLRSLFEVSCAELDMIVETARQIGRSGGVYGARMTGGGFGGCAIVMARADHAQEICAKILQAFTARFDRSPRIRFARAVDGGAVIQHAR